MSESLFNKVAGLRAAILLKMRLWHRCFPVNFVRFLRTLYLQNTSGRLLLQGVKNRLFKSNSISYEICILKLFWQIHLILSSMYHQPMILQNMFFFQICSYSNSCFCVQFLNSPLLYIYKEVLGAFKDNA